MHGVSIHAQEDALKEWGEKNGIYVGCYNDAGISARSRYTKRPALLRLLEDVKARRVDLIIFTKLDRWFRNVGDYYEIQRVLDENGVQWRAIWEDYETQTASGRLKVNIMLSVAQDEADRTGERIKQSIEYRWAKGEVAQRLPVGYKRDGKQVIIDDNKRDGVEAFFAAYLSSGNVSRAREVAREHGLFISRTQATQTLHNRFYSGVVRGISVPAYITQAEYDTIQQRLARYARRPAKHRVYLFSGLLVCGGCGGRMGGRTTKATQTYTCSTYLLHDGCSREARGYANERKLEAWLLDKLDTLLADRISLAKAAGTDSPARQKKEALARKLERIKQLYIDGDISHDDYLARRDDITAQIQTLPAPEKVEQLESLLPQNWREMYDDLSRDGQRAFWLRTVRKIIISKGTDPVVIFCS